MPKCTECGVYAGIGLTLCPACEERQAEGITSFEPSASIPVPSSGAAPAPSPPSPKAAVQPRVIDAPGETALSPEIAAPASPRRAIVPWFVLLLVLASAFWYITMAPKGADRELRGLLSRGQVIEAARVALSPGRMEGYSNETRERLATTASEWVQQRLESWMRESATPTLGWAAMVDVASAARVAEPGVEAHNVRLHYVKGQSAFDAQRYPEARQMFQLAQTAPDRSLRALAQNGLGKVCWRMRDVRCSVDAYRAAISTEPTWVFPYQNLAGVMMQERNYVEAERYYEATIQLTPLRASPHLGLGEVYIATRRYPQARRKFEEALRLLLPSDDQELGRSIRVRLSWLAARGQ